MPEASQVADVMREGILVAIKIGGPLLILSMIVGVLVAIFQAVTQIHEQTLGFILKLVVIVLVILITGGWMLANLQEFTRSIFLLIVG